MLNRPSSESETTALSVQPNDSPKNTNSPRGIPDEVSKDAEFKLAEVRADGVAVVEMEDGRMFTATLPEGMDKPRKGAKLRLAHAGLDKEGVPEIAVIESVL